MRIGTWNLEGKWSSAHSEFLESLACDVLLLTEIVDRVSVAGRSGHATEQLMAPGRHWAGVFATSLRAEPDPHGATAAATVGPFLLCLSVMPWRGSGGLAPWVGADTGERTEHAINCVEQAAPQIWGGDWNHALTGREWIGSKAGGLGILSALDRLQLTAPTGWLPHRIPGLLSIDHIAVPAGTSVVSTEHHPVERALSDHDAYVVGLDPGIAPNQQDTHVRAVGRASSRAAGITLPQRSQIP